MVAADNAVARALAYHRSVYVVFEIVFAHGLQIIFERGRGFAVMVVVARNYHKVFYAGFFYYLRKDIYL